MANNKRRFINTRFWNDSFITKLKPLDKLLFLYFLSNEHSNICGIYELPLTAIAYETGFTVLEIKKSLLKMKEKIRYVDEHVIVKNHLKHQSLKSSDVKKGVVNCLAELNQKFLKDAIKNGLYNISDDLAETVYSQSPDRPRYLDSDLDSNLDLDSIAKPPVESPPVFDLKKEVQKLEDHKRRDMQIIGLYFSKKKPDIKTKAQFDVTLRRHLKAANELKVFDDDQILKAFRKASDFGGWTIETAVKYATK